MNHHSSPTLLAVDSLCPGNKVNTVALSIGRDLQIYGKVAAVGAGDLDMGRLSRRARCGCGGSDALKRPAFFTLTTRRSSQSASPNRFTRTIGLQPLLKSNRGECCHCGAAANGGQENQIVKLDQGFIIKLGKKR
jgi:hypothetical protein